MTESVPSFLQLSYQITCPSIGRFWKFEI